MAQTPLVVAAWWMRAAISMHSLGRAATAMGQLGIQTGPAGYNCVEPEPRAPF
jgi:hypothetical protein